MYQIPVKPSVGRVVSQMLVKITNYVLSRENLANSPNLKCAYCLK